MGLRFPASHPLQRVVVDLLQNVFRDGGQPGTAPKVGIILGDGAITTGAANAAIKPVNCHHQRWWLAATA